MSKPRHARKPMPLTLTARCETIAEEEGFKLSECDPHSMASFLIERGWFDEDEAYSELGFATIMQAMGLEGGY